MTSRLGPILVSLLPLIVTLAPASEGGSDRQGEPAPEVRLENRAMAIVLDSHTGAWTHLIDKRTGENLAAAHASAVPGELAPSGAEGAAIQLEHHEIVPSTGGRGLVVTIRSGAWRMRAEYKLIGDAPILSRQLTVENAGGDRRVLRGVSYSLPPIVVGAGGAIIFPGTLPVGGQPVEGMKPGQALEPRSRDGLCYLWSKPARRALGTWFHSEDEYAPVTVRRDAGTTGGSAAGLASRAVTISHRQGVLAPLEPGERAALGTQFVWLAHGSRDDTLRSVQTIYDHVGLKPPRNALPRLRERIIYCGHPGGVPEKHFRSYGGFKALEAYIPTLKRLRVDILWLLPIFEHGDGKRWNLYSPFDQFKISPLYGTPEELGHLSQRLRTEGIYLIFDLVPHGPPDHTPLGKGHPEWVCLKEDGSKCYVWGQLAFDTAHPGWLEYMARVAAHHAREFGVAGARVDVAAGSPPNWSPHVPYRPSHSTMGGGLGMDRAIREGFLRARKDVLIIPEEYTGANIFYRDGDLTYDAQLFFLLVELEAKKAPPEVWARSIQRFLHDQALTLPRGAMKLRWFANHDTVSWTFQKKRPRDAYGLARSRVLMALCAFIDGVPMIYQGEEDPAIYGGSGESNLDYFERLFELRRRLPSLTGAAADYAGVTATGGVFACTRGPAKDTAIVLLSFNPSEVTSQVSLPPELRTIPSWQDLMANETLGGGEALEIPMAPHGVRVLVPAE